MSSILDALNKLEQEKSQTVRESEHADTDPISIANDLVGRSVLRDRVTLRVTPAALMITAGVLAVGLIVVTFSAAILLTRPDRSTKGEPKTVAAAPAPALAVPVTISEPVPAQVRVPAVNTAPPAKTNPTPLEPSAEMKPAEVAAPSETALVKSTDLAPVSPAPSPAVDTPKATAPKADAPTPPTAAPKPEAAKPPVSDTPKENPAPAAKAPVTEPVAPKPAPVASTPPTRMAAKADPHGSAARPEADEPPRKVSVPLNQLPVLTPLDQSRFGFSRIRVNMVKPSSETTPRGSVLLSLTEESDGGEPVVNRMKVYEGERLQQSTLRLFKVEAGRIGLEDTRSGDQFQLPN